MAKKTNTIPEDPRLEEMRKVAAGHGGKYILLNEEGNIVVPPVYDWIGAPNGGICMIKKDGRYGYIRTDGSIIVEPSYEEAWHFNDGLAAVSIDGKWGFIDDAGRTVIAPQYDERPYFSDGMAAVRQNDKWGYIDRKGNVIVEPSYERAAAFHNGLATIRLNGKYGFINSGGEVVIAPQFEAVGSANQWFGNIWQRGFAIATDGGATGIIDVTGRWVLPPQYAKVRLSIDTASRRQEIDGDTLGEVETVPGGYGRISQNSGKMVVPPVFKQLGKFSEGLAGAQDTNEKCGYINLSGEWVIAPQYNSISEFRGILARVRCKDRRFVINRTGEEVGDNYSLLQYIEGTEAIVIPDRYVIERNGAMGLFDGELKELLPVEFEEIKRWGCTELVMVKKNEKYGLTDKDGREILPIIYKKFEELWNPDSLAAIGEDWGMNVGAVNSRGEWVIPPVYSHCSVYENFNVVTVEKGDLYGLMDMEGRELLPCCLDRVGYFGTDMATARKEGKYGIISNKGEWIIKPEFDDIEVPSEGLVAARRGDKWGFVDYNGEWVIKPAWKRIKTDGFISGAAIAVDDNDKLVIIDRTGKALTKPASTVNLYDVKDGMRRIQVGRKFGYLTEDGKVAIKPVFDEAGNFSQGYAQVSLKVDKVPVWTFIDREGRYGPVYREQVHLFGELTKVKQDEKIALLRQDGTVAAPFIFSRVDSTTEGFTPAQIAGF